jgi:hypothetical protein
MIYFTWLHRKGGEVLVDELLRAFEQAQQQLSDEAQRQLAAQIEAWLSEQE